MNNFVTELITKKASHAAGNAVETAKEAAASIKRYADEEVIISRKMISLKVAAAFLGGLVIGMLISPRKKVSYKIASENHDIGGGEVSVNKPCDEYEYDDYDEDDDDDEDNDKKHGKFIKL